MLGPWDTIKVSLSIFVKGDGKGYQPHQAFMHFYDKVTGEEGVHPLRVGIGGKTRFEMVSIAYSPVSFGAQGVRRA